MSTTPNLAQLCPWILQDQLGKGGNGAVYRGYHKDQPGTAVAIKVLNRGGEAAYKRFRDEVAALRAVGSHAGILPLLDANVPEHPSKARPWLVMPIAEGITEALGPNPTLDQVVTAIAEIASALADLKAEHGISHRDIKPGNLYRFNGAYAVGDFGLVTFPNKEAITDGQDRLGPLYFQAPETLNHPETAEGEPADVYALAKTLWVLATGDRWPQPGQQRRDIAVSRLGTYISNPRIMTLEIFLEKATDLDPNKRVTLAEMRDELHAWLNAQPIETANPDLNNLRNTFSALTDLDRRMRSQAAQRNELIERTGNRIKERLDPLIHSLPDVEGQYISVTDMPFGMIAGNIGNRDPRYPREKLTLRTVGVNINAHGPLLRGNAVVNLSSALEMTAYQDGEDYVAAAHMLWDPFGQQGNVQNAPEVLWLDSAIAQLGSAIEENTIDALAQELTSRFPDAFKAFLQRIELRLQTHGEGQNY